MNNTEPVKKTQGNRKLNQILTDLRRNAPFLRVLSRMKKYLRSETPETIEKQDKLEGQITDRLVALQEEVLVIEKLMDEHQTDFDILHQRLAVEYGIDPDLLIYQELDNILKRPERELSDIYDLCRAIDAYDELLNPEFHLVLHPRLDKRKQSELEVYPVHLEIHKFATKRDVLDFVEKRWSQIEQSLELYRGDKKVRIRKRKLDQKIADLIWANRAQGAQAIKRLLDEQFPENNLVYFEISRIVATERKRRHEKITVGQ